MWVEHIKVSGFRSIREIDVSLDHLTAFVGENSSGKSTILQALEIILDRRKSKTVKLDFHKVVPHNYNQIMIEATFNGLEEKDKKSISKLVGFSLPSFTIRRSGDKETNKIKTELEIPKLKNKLLNQSYVSSTTKKEYLKEVNNGNFPEYMLGPEKKGKLGDIKKGIKRYIKENIDKIEFKGKEFNELKGINLEALYQILPEPLYVPAFDDINKQVDYKKTNMLGKLLDQIFLNLKETGDLDFKKMDTQITNLTNKFKSGKSTRISLISDLETKLSNYIADILPESKALLEFEMPPLEKQMQKFFRILLDDGVLTPVEKKGHGAQRTLTWALLRTYLDNLGERSSSNVIFMVEEPELYLHPQAQRVMLKVLEGLSNHDQVIYSTHSPVFIPMDSPERIRLVRKKDKHTVIDLISQKTIKYKENEARFLTWLDDSRAEIFFAKSVLIVEGDTEKILMQSINQEAIGGKTLDELGCQVLITGGKFSMPFYCRLLNDLNIPFFVIFDKDSKTGKHQETNQHIKNAVEYCNRNNGKAKYHEFHPFLELDWGIYQEEISKIHHIMDIINEWNKKGIKPSKYNSLANDIYNFARDAIK